ncbi:MAG: hypothetical protein ACR2NU_00365 [Aeoliella sp.]
MPENKEPVLQFRLRTLFAWMIFVGVFCTAITSGAGYWGTIFDLTILVILGGGLVASVASTGSSRVFWFAFVVFTVIYLIATYHGFKLLGVRDGVPTSDWINDLSRQFHPDIQFRPGAWKTSSEKMVASNVGFRAVAIMVGTFAAYLCRGIYVFTLGKNPNQGLDHTNA